MQINIKVYDRDENLIFDLPEDTTIQQIKKLAAEKLKFENHAQEMAIIFNQKIINDNSTSISQLECTPDSDIILFIPRYIRLNQEKVTPPISNRDFNQNQKNSNDSPQMRYTPLEADSPLHLLFQRLTINMQKVLKRESPYENPFKIFLQECNISFPDPLVKQNFEIASKLTEEQTIFICESLLHTKLSLAQALNILANASYDPNIARRMV